MKLQPLVREVVVPLDFDRAADALRCYAGGGIVIAASAICALPSLRVEVALLRDVVASIAPLGESAFAVRWRPADGGPFPRFNGTLTVRGEERHARLRLDGAYEDAARGDPVEGELAFRFAGAAASDLLRTIARSAFTEDSQSGAMLGA